MSVLKHFQPDFSLKVIGGLLWVSCVAITFLSSRFEYASDHLSRPVPLVIGTLAAMTVVYLLGLKIALCSKNERRTWRTIWVFAVAMRCVLLFSTPILEIDYYRYLWDGETVLSGVSPYRYSPSQVISAAELSRDLVPADLAQLSDLNMQNKANSTILRRIHFPDLPSIYPPVSQAVFALSALTIPDSVSVETKIVFLKFWIILFDIGVIFLLWKLLRFLKLSISWTIVYAWCPLVLKEFANSGHLDAIAVFFTVLAVLLFVMALFPSGCIISIIKYRKTHSKLNLAGLSLGLAIGAKLYPAVLVPVFVLTVWKKNSMRTAVKFSFLVGIVALATCWPQIGPRIQADLNNRENLPNSRSSSLVSLRGDQPDEILNNKTNLNDNERTGNGVQELPVNGIAMSSSQFTDFNQPAKESLQVFLTQWKMNDFLFRLIEENLSPTRDDLRPSWIAVTPEWWRKELVYTICQQINCQKELVPFLLTRIILSVVTLILALIWAWRGAQANDPREWLHFVFLTLAWFWVLLPTLNPWYWIWVLPFLAFAKRRSWYLVSGLLLLYYFRFWFDYQWGTQQVWGTRYIGEEYFHEVIVWIEHAFWMLALIFETSFSKPLMMYSASQKDNGLLT